MPLVSGDAPLGVFDSGLGGLTVVKALRASLPAESIIYLGDTARVPYGTRSSATVIRYARSCARVLTERGVKGLVIACNTVSAVALELLRAELDIPVLGVIEPGAEAAVDAAVARAGTKQAGGTIGVLGTPGTVRSGAYQRAVTQVSTRYSVVAEAAPLLVPLAEEGWVEGEVPELAVARYLAPLIARDVQVIVLGCTHYPLLRPVVERVAERLLGHSVPVVDSAEAAARGVARLLADGRMLASTALNGSLELLVTDQPQGFQELADRFLGRHSPNVRQIDLPIS